MESNNYKAILIIDFDETIADVNFPVILGLRELCKESINSLYDQNFYIIINTCRDGDYLDQCKEYLINNDIKYHLINENHEYLINRFKSDCRKISGDIHIDDKNIDTLINPKLLQWNVIYENVLNITNQSTFKSVLQQF